MTLLTGWRSGSGSLRESGGQAAVDHLPVTGGCGPSGRSGDNAGIPYGAGAGPPGGSVISGAVLPAGLRKIAGGVVRPVELLNADRGFGGMAYEPRTDPVRKEHERFARELADYLEEGARTQAYGSLVVFAGNPFLGELREALGDGTRRLLKTSLPVDLSHVGAAEIERRVLDELASA